MTAWALADRLGVGLPSGLVRPLSVALTGACVLAYCAAARRRELDLTAMFAGSLWVTLLTLYLTLPAYVIWALPFTVVCIARMRGPSRLATAALLFCWGAAEWGGNLFRGVALALEIDRPDGKSAIAAQAERLFGAGFPFEAAYLALVVLALGSGALVVRQLFAAGASTREARV